MNQTTDSRREQVARAKKLIRDPDYPAPHIVESVAQLLADTWSKPDKPMSER